jgi:hypothetical protein
VYNRPIGEHGKEIDVYHYLVILTETYLCGELLLHTQHLADPPDVLARRQGVAHQLVL